MLATFAAMPPAIRYRMLRALALMLALAGFVAAPAGSASAAPALRTVNRTGVNLTGVNARVSDLPPALAKVFRRVNTIRAERGLPKLTLGLCLTERVAQPWAAQMARTGNFEHRSMTSVRDKCPKNGWVGENIAYGYTSAKEVMRAWMNSPGHRENILRPQYRRIGLGLQSDANGRIYWVQNFGGN